MSTRSFFTLFHLGVVPTLTPWLYLSYQSIAVMGEGSVCSLRLHLPEHLHLLWQPAVKPFSFHTLKLPPGMDGGKKITLTGWDCFSTSAVSCHFKRHVYVSVPPRGRMHVWCLWMCFSVSPRRTPWFNGWGFNLPRGQSLLDKWNLIPEGIDILMTHGPPLGEFN